VVAGDCVEALATLPAASADAVVCDPPYGIGFQRERWDGQAIRDAAARGADERMSARQAYQAWCRSWACRCLEALKPGAHLAAFGSPRTAHRLACALEEAGFELRDTLIWLYGTGLPKSRKLPDGRASSLKPAYEPILLARRPPKGPLERNLEAHGTGALNADACRLEGRFPANVLLSHAPDCRPETCAPGCTARLVDAAADGTRVPSGSPRQASRLFYCPKASRAERDAGCEGLPRRRRDLFPNAQAASYEPPPAANTHPTVKPLALMRWLVRLVIPPDGLVLDPFCGSGSTGCAAVLEGRRFLGIELDPGYAEIARARIGHWAAERTTGGDGEAEVRAGPFAPATGTGA
jgi:DNA modification methylase